MNLFENLCEAIKSGQVSGKSDRMQNILSVKSEPAFHGSMSKPRKE